MTRLDLLSAYFVAIFAFSFAADETSTFVHVDVAKIRPFNRPTKKEPLSHLEEENALDKVDLSPLARGGTSLKSASSSGAGGNGGETGATPFGRLSLGAAAGEGKPAEDDDVSPQQDRVHIKPFDKPGELVFPDVSTMAPPMTIERAVRSEQIRSDTTGRI